MVTQRKPLPDGEQSMLVGLETGAGGGMYRGATGAGAIPMPASRNSSQVNVRPPDTHMGTDGVGAGT